MLSFKEFITFYLTEATIKHFAHLGLDPDNQEHNDLVDAYNLGHSKNDPNVPRNPNQIKSLEHLTAVANSVHNPEEGYETESHLGQIRRQRKEDERYQKAIKSGHAKLIHHDPETGVKVFKVKSGKGCAAVGSSKWCVSDKQSGDSAFTDYDPERKHSYVIHTPEKGNLSRIGIIGVRSGRSHRSGLGGNFQDKGNVTVTDSDWEKLRKKYKLDSVDKLGGIRGIPVSEKEKKRRDNEISRNIKNGKFSLDDLENNIEDGKLNQNHINLIINHPYGPYKKDNHVNRVIDYHNDRHGYELLNDDHINSIINNEDLIYSHENLVNSRNITLKNHQVQSLVNNPYSQHAHSSLVVSHSSGYGKYKLSPEQISTIAAHPNSTRAHKMLVDNHVGRYENNRPIKLSDTDLNNIINNPNSIEAHLSLAEFHKKGKIKLSDDQIKTILSHPKTNFLTKNYLK